MEVIALFLMLLQLLNVNSNEIRLGGLFRRQDALPELSFRYAVEKAGRELLRNRLEAKVSQVPEHESYQTSLIVCQMLAEGVAGIFGPDSSETALHVQSMCDAKEIPHIETRWDPYQKHKLRSLNIYPHPNSLSRALVDMVQAWEWTTFTILYQSELELSQFTEILKLTDSGDYVIVFRQLDDGQDFRPTLREIKYSGSTNIILTCNTDILPEVLKQAQQVGLMVSEYSFIIANMDMHTLDLEFLQYGGTNITGLSLVDPEDPDVIDTVKRWVEREAKAERVLEITPETVHLDAALMNDAVWLFAKAARELRYAQNISVTPQDCESVSTWALGSSLANYMKHTEVKGMTGLVKMDTELGLRMEFTVHLNELTGDGIKKIGSWNSTHGLNITRPQPEVSLLDDENSLVNKSFIVLIAMSAPYSMLKEDSKQLAGNDRYEGFGNDLIHELSLMLGFNYTYVVQEDNNYGSLNKVTKKWNGMMLEIMEGRADLAITDLTITHDRESAVDFTMPFMNLGISILYKAPMKEPPSLFSFLSPFSNEVWMYMLGAYIGVSVLMYVMARISPYEWNNPYPCIEEPEELENQFSLKNSLWFTIGSLMQQGSEIAPIAVSTRMVAGIWWFFTLIMVSSYTANLAAFLTVEPVVQPFSNVEQLASQNVIKYGAKKGGSTAAFFIDSSHRTFGKMGAFMSAHPEAMTSSNDQGMQKVREEEYAYIMESTSIEYIIERNCDLTQIGGLLDNKGYGIAMRKNSPYRNALSTAVLQLQENGQLTSMKRKWWKEKRGGGACEAGSDDDGAASALDLSNVGGVFVVLVFGCFAACFITVAEMLWNIKEATQTEKVKFKEKFMEEVKFIAKCHGSTKPVNKREPSEEGKEENSINSEHLERGSTNYGWFVSDENKAAIP